MLIIFKDWQEDAKVVPVSFYKNPRKGSAVCKLHRLPELGGYLAPSAWSQAALCGVLVLTFDSGILRTCVLGVRSQGTRIPSALPTICEEPTGVTLRYCMAQLWSSSVNRCLLGMHKTRGSVSCTLQTERVVHACNPSISSSSTTYFWGQAG